MVRSGFLGLCLGGVLLASAGCRMCPQPHEDYAYAAYGGLLQRADMFHGRVGSAFNGGVGQPVPAGHEGAYEGPAPMSPEEAPPQIIEPAAYQQPAAQSQPAPTAFDPGDILSPGPR